MEQAHIGVGLGGSETKSNIRIANVVLLDDSISGIVESVSQGRTVFYAMKKMVYAYINTSYNLYLICFISTIVDLKN